MAKGQLLREHMLKEMTLGHMAWAIHESAQEAPVGQDREEVGGGSGRTVGTKRWHSPCCHVLGGTPKILKSLNSDTFRSL